jgi:hypothetical protein
MFRKAVFASLIALGAASAGAARAADEGPYLVNRNGTQEVVYGTHANNVVGGAFATITGGGDNTVYRAAPAGARFEEPRLVGRLSGGGDDEAITYTAPGAQAARLGARG